MKYILLAEDDEDDRLFFSEALTKIRTDVRLDIAFDGDIAIKMLARPGYIPALAVLDINMPGKTGLECLEHIRKDARLKEMPVVIFSTSSDEVIVQRAYASGADLYISKPNSFSDFNSVMLKILSHIDQSE